MLGARLCCCLGLQSPLTVSRSCASQLLLAAGDKRIDQFDYHTVVIDESTQATEPQTLVPLVMGANHVTSIQPNSRNKQSSKAIVNLPQYSPAALPSSGYLSLSVRLCLPWPIFVSVVLQSFFVVCCLPLVTALYILLHVSNCGA